MASPLRVLALALLVVTSATVAAFELGPHSAPAARTYVGQESCMASGCHAGAYSDSSDYRGAAAFRETMHQRIHLRPSPETVVIDNYFAGDSVLKVVLNAIPVVGKDTLIIRLSKSDDGREYYAQMSFSGGGDTLPPMKIEYTYGGNGWIQRFLVKVDRSYYVLPFQYILPQYRVRSDSSRTFYFLDLNRWFSVDNGVPEFLDFSSASFHKQAWDKDCASCHTNGFDIALRVNGEDTVYQAEWVGVAEGDSALQDENIRIGCESCHGPGSEHVAAPSRDNIVSPGRWPATVEGTDLRLDLCNNCHTRARSTRGTFKYPYDEERMVPYVPGEELRDYIRDPWADGQYWVDRTTSYAHHQTGQDFLRSGPYTSHVFTDGCWNCHSSHTNGLPGMPYQLKENYYSLQDGVGCLGCHGSTGAQRTPPLADMSRTSTVGGRLVNTHTQHSPAASECVACHFTKVATISFEVLPTKQLYEFSDHGFKVFRPSLTIENRNSLTGMINTCASSCHRNGRGTRNLADSTPVAPSFGIYDFLIGLWKEDSDIALADTLWRRYQQMYSQFLRAEPVDAEPFSTSRIVSIAPNPLRSTARVEVSIARTGAMTLALYDAGGRFVRTLASGEHVRGRYAVTWDGADEAGTRVPAGAYLLRLRAPDGTSSTGIAVVR